MFEGEVQFVGAGSGICFLPDEGGGSTEGVDGAGMVADPGSGLDWMVDTAGYGSGISGSGSQTYIFESKLKIYGSGISGSGSQTYIFESILKIYWVKTNNFLKIGPNICQHFRCDFFWT